MNRRSGTEVVYTADKDEEVAFIFLNHHGLIYAAITSPHKPPHTGHGSTLLDAESTTTAPCSHAQ